MKIKKDKIYKVYWRDITSHTHQIPFRPFRKMLAVCWTCGYIEEDKDVIIVIYGENTDEEKSFDVIPKSNIIKIEPINN